MPIYEFTCDKCGETFEELVLGGRIEGIKCPKCGSTEVKKLMSACAFKSGGKFVSSSGGSACAGCAGGTCSTCGR
ncbi:MAG: zinc ribbon domain-containing protein [Thermodesulfobacteria bacterium]|nr:zinc ribbon domain-containing protein [Thermodesulfobacteriota bacterium]